MYLSREHKIIVLWNPKTGSQSIHRYLRLNVPDSDFGPAPLGGRDPKLAHWHGRLCQVTNYFEISPEELPNYRIAVFWRDPIERLLSGYAYHQEDYPDVAGILNLDEYLEEHGKYLHPQWMFLTDRNFVGERVFDGIDFHIEWFNFHDYENEFRRLAGWFGLTPGEQAPPGYPTQGNEIPHARKTNRLQIEDLTQGQIDTIKEAFRADYELLESRGIITLSRDL